MSVSVSATYRDLYFTFIFNYTFSPQMAASLLILKLADFPGDAVVKNPPANAGDMGSSPGPGRSHMLWSN